MSEIKLNPCPFCGENVGLFYCFPLVVYVVKCYACGAETPRFSSIDEAINYWNRGTDNG